MLSKICCIGAGYVGGSTLAVIAQQCPDIQVTVVDISQDIIDMWNSDIMPICEPGLDEIVKSHRGKNLHFSTNIDQAIADAELIFISVNTPTKSSGLGKGRASDLTNLEAAARRIAQVSKWPKIVVEKSTVPVKAAETIQTILCSQSTKKNGFAASPDGDADFHLELDNFVVLSNPEFLAEGTAVKDIMYPDRILIGGDVNTRSGRLGVEALRWIYSHWVPNEKIFITSTWSSELSKLAANAFLAQRISGINAISAICEKANADVRDVSKSIGTDHRIGPHYLNASLGFGGSCFRKDLLNLVYMCETLNLPEVASYWYSVLEFNDYQTLRFTRNVISKFHNTLKGKRIAIFGFTFKADTHDTRDTPAIKVCYQLLQEQAHLAIYDPMAKFSQMRLDLLMDNSEDIVNSHVELCHSAEEAASNAHAILICTEWKCFQKLNYEMLYKSMCKPPRIFDGRLILDHAKLIELGFHVEAVGIAPSTLTTCFYKN